MRRSGVRFISPAPIKSTTYVSLLPQAPSSVTRTSQLTALLSSTGHQCRLSPAPDFAPSTQPLAVTAANQMAAIRERIDENGQKSFQAQVRIQGFPARSKTFLRKTDAKKWSVQTETEIRTGMRKGEIMGMRWQDIHTSQEQNFTRIHLTKTKKQSRSLRSTYLTSTPTAGGAYSKDP